jgi:hypothetical protein
MLQCPNCYSHEAQSGEVNYEGIRLSRLLLETSSRDGESGRTASAKTMHAKCRLWAGTKSQSKN